jgi:hypothetical protein
MTLAEQGGRLFVSVQAIVAYQPRTPADPAARCGIDLGIGDEWTVIAHGDDQIERVAHPAPWAALQRQGRRAARQLSRRTVDSRANHGGQAHAQAWACEAPQDHPRVAGADDART